MPQSLSELYRSILEFWSAVSVVTRALMILGVGICFSVAGELMLKAGMNRVGVLSLQPGNVLEGLWRSFTNPLVLAGFVSVFLASIFWLGVISRIPLSLAYPMMSLSYVVVVFASALLLREQVTFTRVAGVAVIIVGVYIVYRS